MQTARTDEGRTATLDESRNDSPTGSKRWRPYIALAAAEVATWFGAYAFGVRFDISRLNGSATSDPWQLLDRHLLKTQLLSSIWHLHSQPPLFNLLSGLLLKLPAGSQQSVGALLFVGCGFVLVLSTYQAMVDLTVPKWLAFCVTVLLIVEPSNILYGHWYSYEYPTATFLSLAALCCVRYLRTTKRLWGFGFLMSMAIVILLDSTYQALWLVVVLVFLLVTLRRQWRSVVAVCVVPVILVGGWYLKDFAQFGTLTTSSWLGMNLAEATLAAAPPGLVDRLVQRGTLTPIAKIFPFAPVASYVPRWAPLPHTGIPILDDPMRSDGTTNYNNLVYVRVSELYLPDDVAYILAEPGRYADTVAKGVALWFVPGDEYFIVAENENRIDHWTRLYDGVVLGQISNHENAAVSAIFFARGPSLTQIPWVTLVEWLIALFGVPIVGLRLRRRDPATAVALVVIWFTMVYAFVTTSLVEFGENERFGFELGPLPVIAAVAAGAIFYRWIRGDEKVPPADGRAYTAAIPPSLSPPSLSIIIPVLNEEDEIARILDGATKHLEERGGDWEIIIVDNASTDRTLKRAEPFLEDERVRFLSNEVNRGKGFSIRRGMLEARCDLRLMCDADCVTSLRSLPLLEKATETADVAVGSRLSAGARVSHQQPFRRRIVGVGFITLTHVVMGPLPRDVYCGFKLWRAEAATQVFERVHLDGWAFDAEALAMARRFGYEVREVGIEWTNRPDSRLSIRNVLVPVTRELLAARLNVRRAALAGEKARSR